MVKTAYYDNGAFFYKNVCFCEVYNDSEKRIIAIDYLTYDFNESINRISIHNHGVYIYYGSGKYCATIVDEQTVNKALAMLKS